MLDRRLVLAALTGLSASCATGSARQTHDFKLVTFNIWHNQGDWSARQPLLIHAIRAEKPDVVALQEVLQDAAVGLPNQAETIAQALGPDYRVFFSSVDAEGAPRRYGNALVTRLPVLGQDFVRLRPLEDSRTALRVRVDVGGQAVDLVTTHLAWQPDAGAVRREQIAHMMEWIPKDDTPLVILGDLNAEMTQPEISNLRGERFVEAFSFLHPEQAATTTMNLGYFNGQGMHIDHVLLERTYFTPRSARLIGTEQVDGQWPSDHFGIAVSASMR